MRTYKQLSSLVMVVGLLLLMSVPALAATAAPETSASTLQTVAQAYSTAKPLQLGMIVQINNTNKDLVESVNYKNAKRMLGVTVAASEAPVSLSSNAAGQVSYVVTSGRYKVLVSTQNGSISSGDLVSVSAIDGIGMKSDNTVVSILGRAVDNFDGTHNVISTTNLKTSDGKQKKAAIGSLTVDIAIGPNPNKALGESGVPNFVQKVAVNVVGKPISAAQMYASIIVIILGIGVVASLLYGGIQTGMTSIGRNPLARKSIIRSMTQVIVAGLMIFIGCLFAVYLILKI